MFGRKKDIELIDANRRIPVMVSAGKRASLMQDNFFEITHDHAIKCIKNLRDTFKGTVGLDGDKIIIRVYPA